MWYSGLGDKYHSAKMVHLLNPLAQSAANLATVWDTDRHTDASIWIIVYEPFNWYLFLVLFCMRQFEEVVCHHSIRSDQHFNTHTPHTRLKFMEAFTVFIRKPLATNTHTHTHTHIHKHVLTGKCISGVTQHLSVLYRWLSGKQKVRKQNFSHITSEHYLLNSFRAT